MKNNTKKEKAMYNLVEISKLVTESTDFFVIKDNIIDKMLQVVHPTKACVNLFYKNSFKYAYLVCSSTLNYIPTLFSDDSPRGVKIDFSTYPKYIQEAVCEQKIVWVKDIFEDERAIDERAMASEEGYNSRIVFPLIANDRVVGFLTCFLNKDETLSDDDIAFISSVTSLISLSIEITKKNSDIDVLVNKLRGALNSINEATKKLYTDESIQSFLDHLSRQACHITKSKAALVVIDDEESKKQLFSHYIPENEDQNTNIYGALGLIKENDITSKYYDKGDLSKEIEEQNVGTLIYHKLHLSENHVGYIAAANSEKYTIDDLKVLSIFAKQVSVGMQLYKYNIAKMEHELVENELKVLSEQQRLMMNESNIKFVNNKEISFYHKPSKLIGGDFCHVLKVNEDKRILLLVDVMGHGIVSNYFVAMLKGTFKTLALSNKSSSEIVSSMNEILYEEFDKMGVFATARVDVIDVSQNSICSSNAGHHLPIGIHVLENGEVISNEIEIDKGLPLGVIDKMAYSEGCYCLEDYNLICMFTDGVLEVKNKDKEEYGIDRLKKFLECNYKLNTSEIFEKLEQELIDFSNEEHYEDDILLVFLKNI